ncbi:MAG: hypothetical protein ACYC3S_09565 [Chloroflexota bacterium]
MKRLGAIVGVILLLVGMVRIGQGMNLVPGSMMSGQPVYAVLGLGVVALGVGLICAIFRSTRARPGLAQL